MAAAIAAVLGFPAGPLGGTLLLGTALGFQPGALSRHAALLLALGGFAARRLSGPFALEAGEFFAVFGGRKRSGRGR